MSVIVKEAEKEKKQKSSDSVIRGPPPLRELVTALGYRAEPPPL